MKESVDVIMRDKKLTPKKFASLAGKHGLSITVENAKTKIYPDYASRFDKFFQNKDNVIIDLAS